MPCDYGTVRTTGVRIRHQVSRRTCAEVLAALEVSRRPAQRSQQLQNLSILIVKFRSILNAPPSLQGFSGARENALAESESALQCSRGVGSFWKCLAALARATGVSGRLGYGFRTELHFADVELNMWNRRPFMSASHLEMVSYATRCIVKALAEVPHWQMTEMYWNTTMQQFNIWSIAFEARI